MPLKGIQLPSAVSLPLEPVMRAADVRAALGVSKAVLHLWRRDRDFPRGVRSGATTLTNTDALEQWLKARGVAVARVAPPPPPLPPPPFVPMPLGYEGAFQ